MANVEHVLRGAVECEWVFYVVIVVSGSLHLPCDAFGCSKKVKRKEITDHANPEGNGPQHSKERGRGGSTGPPQPEPRSQKHHRDPRCNNHVLPASIHHKVGKIGKHRLDTHGRRLRRSDASDAHQIRGVCFTRLLVARSQPNASNIAQATLQTLLKHLCHTYER